MRSHDIDYRIIGDDIQLVEIELDPMETVIAEAGTMMYMDRQIRFETKMGDGSEPNQGLMGKLLSAGNEVLIVSKPHLDCIRAICNAFERYRDIFELVDDHYRYRMVFRFTIGACDDRILSFWEPNAPVYEERKAALKYAFETGFQTSVSVEPMLDSKNIDDLVSDLLLYITDSFWIGEMNHIGRFSKYGETQVQDALNDIKAGQTDSIIRDIYNRYQGNPMIKWKNGIKKMLGLPLATTPGLDI